MIKIIPTSHLMKASDVEELIKKENPDIIGIELCEFREQAILQDLEKTSPKGTSLLNKITDKIKQKAEKEGLDYGADMKAALNYSINNNIPRVLVDMPVIKIQELFSKIPAKEQEGFIKELTEFENSNINQKVDENEVIRNMKTNYPVAFEFLINMRNLFIANKILVTEKNNKDKKIVVILGAAHVDLVNKLIGF